MAPDRNPLLPAHARPSRSGRNPELAAVLDLLRNAGIELPAMDPGNQPGTSTNEPTDQREVGSEVGSQVGPEHVPPESGDNLQIVKQRFCSARKLSGAPCRAAPRTGRTLCIYHDPDFARQRRYYAARGRRKSRPAPPVDFPDLPFAIQDRASLQVVLDALLRLHLFGKIPLNRSSHILRALSLAARTFDHPTRIVNRES